MELKDIQAQQDRAAALWRKAREGEEKFYADVPFTREIIGEGKAVLDESLTKDAKKGDIITRGYGSTWAEDRDQEFVHPNAFDASLAGFLALNPMMLWQHNMDWPLGKYLDARTDPYGLDMLGLVPQPADREPDWKHLAYHSIARGIVRTKSIGGYFRRKYDPDLDRLWIIEVDLMETSIVSIPANPTSIFEAAVKCVGGGSYRPTLTQAHIDQMMQILGASPMTDPELLSMNEKGLRARHAEIAEFYEKCGRTAPSYEEWDELARDVFSSKGLEAVRGGGTRVVAFLRKAQGHVTPTGEEDVTIISVPPPVAPEAVRTDAQTGGVQSTTTPAPQPVETNTGATAGITININTQKEG